MPNWSGPPLGRGIIGQSPLLPKAGALTSSMIAALEAGFTVLNAMSQTILWPVSPRAQASVVNAELQIVPNGARATVSFGIASLRVAGIRTDRLLDMCHLPQRPMNKVVTDSQARRRERRAATRS